MCYGMGCSYEGYMGECIWDGGMPYPCQEQLEDRKRELVGMLRRAINERVALKAEIAHLKDKLEEVM